MDTRSNAHRQLRIGLIGCGKMGLNHVKAIRACSAATLVAVADPAADPAKLKTQLPEGVKHYSSAREMLETERLDVVHIVTPPNTHTDLAMLAVEHGAHVYVEKPFTLTTGDASRLLDAAARAGKLVCPGHQLLFEGPARSLAASRYLIGRVVHAESYFAFKTVRKSRDGRSPLSPVEQLLDILPHPVYSLLDALQSSEPTATPEIVSLDVRAEGDVHALLRAGDVTANLTVTLRGRPVESYLRLVGTNGCLRADFVRGALIELAGAGTSIFSLMSNPYREAKQVFFRSTKGFGARILARKKGYPGLTELFESFYERVASGGKSPLTPESIVATVRVCEQIGVALRAAESAREQQAEMSLVEKEKALVPADERKGMVLVTGGTGTLGKAVVSHMRQRSWPIRVVSRRLPPLSNREAGVEYVAADLGGGVDDSLLAGISTIVHCAAETAGGKEAHDRNTIAATRNLLEAAARVGITRFVHISSIAVLKTSKVVGGPLSEKTPVDLGNLARGPYVWAKAESEREVMERGPALGVGVRVLRPGPLVDFAAYEPPGRLGRELGPIFLAIGPKKGRLSLCDVQTAAHVIRGVADDFEAAPPVINLVEPDAPTRAALLSMWLEKRPDLRAVWMPSWVLATLSPVAKLAQKVLRPKATPIDIAAAFASERYDASLAAQAIRRAQSV